jgi:hypothetical protein
MKRVQVPERIESLAREAVDSALAVHRALGPGLLESAYRGHTIPRAFRIDLLVDQSLLLELEAVEAVLPVHRVQLATYLRLIKQPLGLLINFNVPLLKDGITRVLNLDFQTEFPAAATLAPLRAP